MNTRFFEIYWLDGKVWGTPLRGETTYRLRLEYENCFNLPGKTACFFLVTRDDTIRREDAIVFAATIAAGRFVWVNLDLSSLGTAGKVKKCPPTST